MAETMIAWHASRTPLTEARPYLHVGTRRQAEMRGGLLHQVVMDACRPSRVRDRSENLWNTRRLDAARRRGHALIVYLNRTEGIPLEEFERAMLQGKDLDAMSDTAFRRLVPSAEDSWIIVDPGIVQRIVPEKDGRNAA